MILPAQRPIAVARMCDEDDDALVTETIVLPNLIVMLSRDPDTGVLYGNHAVCSPNYANEFVESLEAMAEHVTECENPGHAGRYMTMLDPESAFS